VVVPSVHRLMRSKYGRTMHAELIPSPLSEVAQARPRPHPEGR
jgi:hypothetical protein